MVSVYWSKVSCSRRAKIAVIQRDLMQKILKKLLGVERLKMKFLPLDIFEILYKIIKPSRDDVSLKTKAQATGPPQQVTT